MGVVAGTIVEKVGGRRYLYFEFFDGRKTVQKYCGPEGSEGGRRWNWSTSMSRESGTPSTRGSAGSRRRWKKLGEQKGRPNRGIYEYGDNRLSGYRVMIHSPPHNNLAPHNGMCGADA